MSNKSMNSKRIALRGLEVRVETLTSQNETHFKRTIVRGHLAHTKPYSSPRPLQGPGYQILKDLRGGLYYVHL
jgi:hypothetical protein